MSLRVNVGCGGTPTPGWTNLDNSLSVRLARRSTLLRALEIAGIVNDRQRALAKVAAKEGILWAQATRLPLADGSADVLYTSHMFEHLDRRQAAAFLREALRVLRPGGILRIVVPDLRRIVDDYIADRDCDKFVASIRMSADRPSSMLDRLRIGIVGLRNHAWMYDAEGLKRIVTEHGFREATAMEPGKTTINDPGALDLRERESESIYVEATKPRE